MVLVLAPWNPGLERLQTGGRIKLRALQWLRAWDSTGTTYAYLDLRSQVPEREELPQTIQRAPAVVRFVRQAGVEEEVMGINYLPTARAIYLREVQL